ncbi:MAG TPA: hypothetical protein VKZ43_09995 [Trueperaceae bacterium]|nr:hypothetical protein [Trueperaceae bacterium]
MENLGTQVPGASAEAAIKAPDVKKEAKPRRTAPRQKPTKAATSANGERMYAITLHDNKEIPPNGQFIGVNGRQFLLRPGHKVRVPASVLEVLNNAVHALPEINEKMQVTGMRNAPRLSYTLHPDG